MNGIEDCPSLSQVSTSSPAHWAVATDLADNSKASKQGWGQTKIGQVLQAKVSMMWYWKILSFQSSGRLTPPDVLPTNLVSELTG